LAALGLLYFLRFFQRSVDWRSNLVSGAFVGCVSIALAFALGGFFQFASGSFDGESMKFAWPPGYLRYEYFGSRFPMSPWQAALWYVDGFGLLLAVLPPALY